MALLSQLSHLPRLISVKKSFYRNINMSLTPRIISNSELPTHEAKWITLRKIKYSDAKGKERFWECAQRTTRKSSGIDAVAVMALIRSQTKAFPLSTVIIEEFRPPVGKYTIALPAGLIDEGETVEMAAIRELEEETGFRADSIEEVSDEVVCDPGMTDANMKLVLANVTLEDKLTQPEQTLEEGEFIVPRVVELSKLHNVLKDYVQKGFVVDAKLSFFAIGFDFARKI